MLVVQMRVKPIKIEVKAAKHPNFSMKSPVRLLVATSLMLTASTMRAESTWPLFRGDPNMLGISSETLMLPLKLAWDFTCDAPVPATAVIADDRVFVGSFDKFFYCLDLKTGEVIWKFETKLGVEGPACITGDLVCFGDSDGFVFGLKRDTGEEVWLYQTEDAIVGGLNFYVTKEGKTLILVGSDDFYLHGIDAKTGEQAWTVETGNYIRGAPSVDAETGVVIMGGCDEILRLIDANVGTAVKEIEIGAYMANSCSVRDQIAYVAHYAGEILAIDLKSGQRAWAHDTGGTEFIGSPAVTEEHVIIGGRDKKLRCLDRATGELVWDFTARRAIDSSPVVTPEAIFIGSDDGRLYALDPADGSQLWTYDIGARMNSSPAIASGYLVICGQDGGIYAFKSGQKDKN